MPTESLTFEAAITPAGMVALGSAIMLLVAIIKGVLPAVDARVSGATLATLIAAVFYVITALVLPSLDANGYLNIVWCWLGVSATAIGVNGALRHVATVSGKESPI